MRALKVSGLLLVLATLLLVVSMFRRNRVDADSRLARVQAGRTPIAVLGDSDSHSYRDGTLGTRRGGEYHAQTYQWSELLALLRSEDVDLGRFETSGFRGAIARPLGRVGVVTRSPRKTDFRFNFAVSGNRCRGLTEGWPNQARWATRLLDSDPQRWSDGLVVIRIGVNDLGQLEHLRAYANAGLTPAVEETVETCTSHIREAVVRLRGVSSAAILLVGIADDSSWPPSEVPEWAPEEVETIRAVLNSFDDALSSVAAEYERVEFMADRSWYYDRWPDRDEAGSAVVGGVDLGGSSEVTNTRGDEPTNLLLEDGHAGTVANGMWANMLVREANRLFGFGIGPLLEIEMARIADPDGRFGIAPPDAPPGTPPVVVGLPERIEFRSAGGRALVPPFEAYDGSGRSVLPSAVAFLSDGSSARRYLYGDGSEMWIDDSRHPPGTYEFTVVVRDGWGRRRQVVVPAVVR